MPTCCVAQFSFKNFLIGLCFTIIFCLSVLGNSIVIIMICKSRQKSIRSITNIYLLNLAIADLLRSVICMPTTLLSELSRCWLLGPMVCKMAAYLQPVSVSASAYTLAVIALERFYAICCPLQCRKWQSKRRAVTMIILVWIHSFVANGLSLVMFDAYPYKSAWNCRSTASPIIDFFYQLYLTFILLLVPLIIMMVLYGNVILKLKEATYQNLEERRNYDGDSACYLTKRISIASWLFDSFTHSNSNRTESVATQMKQKRSVPARFLTVEEAYENRSKPLRKFGIWIRNSALWERDVWRSTSFTYQLTENTRAMDLDKCYLLRSTHQKQSLIAKKRVTRMLIILVIAFLICWTPSFIWWLLIKTTDLLGIGGIYNDSLNMVITLLTYISTCTNPITYCFMNEGFRNNVVEHYLCCSSVCKRKLNIQAEKNSLQRQLRPRQLESNLIFDGVCKDEMRSMKL